MRRWAEALSLAALVAATVSMTWNHPAGNDQRWPFFFLLSAILWAVWRLGEK